MTHTFRVILAAGLMALGASASADVIPAERVKAMVDNGDILPLQQIIKMNEADLEGRIVEIELESEDGRFFYEFKILPQQGHYRKIEIDAANGAIVRRK